MKIFSKIIFTVFFVVLTIIFLYEIVYIPCYPAIYHLQKAATKIHARDNTFRVYYYFKAIEFSNDSNPDSCYQPIFGDNSISISTNYVLLTKEGLFVNKKTSYFITNITSLCIIISDDLNLRELNKGYQFIKKHFKYQKLYVTLKVYLDNDYELNMNEPLKVSFESDKDNDFQEVLQKLQKSK